MKFFSIDNQTISDLFRSLRVKWKCTECDFTTFASYRELALGGTPLCHKCEKEMVIA
jgi:hypothetical protein